MRRLRIAKLHVARADLRKLRRHAVQGGDQRLVVGRDGVVEIGVTALQLSAQLTRVENRQMDRRAYVGRAAGRRQEAAEAE